MRKEMDEFEGFMRSYEPRVRRVFRGGRDDGGPTINDRARLLLLSTTASARLLTASIIHALNVGFVNTAYLGARAHYEQAAMLAYAVVTLDRYKAGSLSRDEASSRLVQLHLGHRIDWGVPTDLPRKVEKAVNVLTLIDAVDKLADDGAHKGKFREDYEFLSEFCHPNLLSRMVSGHMVDDVEDLVRFHLEPKTRRPDLGNILPRGLFSQAVFFHCYSRIETWVGGIPSYEKE